MTTTHLIAVAGSSPGVGKSTLCTALAGRLAATGAAVDHFEEADILTRPAFRPVADEFAGGSGSVRPATLLDATREYVAQARADGTDVLVTDALIPFVPSLVAWGHREPEIAAFVAELAGALDPARVSVLYLRDDPEAALRRAVEREGPAWADWYVGKLGGSPGTRAVDSLRAAARHLREEAALTLGLLAATPWDVQVVDVAGRGPDEVAATACARLGLA
ncbi:hypothetical protein [Streptomyces pinistramenti]|uniref:hypothetical protein n=1 Tax=Streptomyces pinistramenti TaxID=2884812 RepID=UPI001D069947|nr:hypothetical protein [Streptomyces pinistramenti]MCB5909533.1 hypothetical protein [Streptomyces pinistramenti]